MNKRLSELCCGLEIDSIDIEEKANIKNIMEKVNDTLNVDLKERAVYRKQKFIKTIVIIVALLVLATTTVFAAVKADILKLHFAGDTAPYADFVETKKQSVTDGQYKLTLEQVLVSKYQAFVVYTVEGLTEESQAKLMEEDYFGIGLHEISFEPKKRECATISGFTQGEIIELKTKTSRTFQIYSDSFLNEDGVDFILRLGCMEEGKEITVPMKCNVESKEFILEGQPYGNAILRYSPLGIYFERNYETQNETDTELYFRMKNGEIKTCNDLANVWPGGRMNSFDVFDEQRNLWRYGSTGFFYEITELSAFQSIIVANIEYDIKDITKTKPIVIDEKLRPFELKPALKDETTWIPVEALCKIAAGVHYQRNEETRTAKISYGNSSILIHDESIWLPVEALCHKLGADYQWNKKTRAAKIDYHGDRYIITEGSSILLRNGKACELYENVYMLEGQLIAPISLRDDMHFKLQTKDSFETMQRLFAGTSNIKDTVWIITP